jgi:hypothetical protein
MRPWVLGFWCALVLCGSSSGLAQHQQTGPRTLENLLNSGETQKPAAADEAAKADATDDGPKRPAGTVVRPKDGVKHPDLDKAWAEYDAAVAKVTESMKAAIAKQFDAATAKGDLDAADKWQIALEKFETAGELPTEKQTKAAVSAAVTDCKEAREELAKAYEAVVKTLTMERSIAEAKTVRNEQNGLQSVNTSDVGTTKPESSQVRRQPEDNRKIAPIPRGVTLTTWEEVRNRELPIQQAPAKTTAKATSSHPGNFSADNAVDGDALTQFAFLGAKGELMVDFGGGVECSGLLLRSRPAEADVCTRGFVMIDDAAPFPFENFGGGRVLLIGLGRKQKVRKVIFHSEQGRYNPGVCDLLLIP